MKQLWEFVLLAPGLGEHLHSFRVYSFFFTTFGISKFVKLQVKCDKFLHAFAECEPNLSDDKLLIQTGLVSFW